MHSSSGAHSAAVLAHTHRGYERLAIEQALRDADLSRPSLVRRVVARLARRRGAGASAVAAPEPTAAVVTAPVTAPVPSRRPDGPDPNPQPEPLEPAVHTHPYVHLLVEQTRSAELQQLSRLHADARAARRAARSPRTARLLPRWPSVPEPLSSR